MDVEEANERCWRTAKFTSECNCDKCPHMYECPLYAMMSGNYHT